MIQFLLENLQERQLSKDCSSDICIDGVFLILCFFCFLFFAFFYSKNEVIYSSCLSWISLKSLMPLFNLQILEREPIDLV